MDRVTLEAAARILREESHESVVQQLLVWAQDDELLYAHISVLSRACESLGCSSASISIMA